MKQHSNSSSSSATAVSPEVAPGPMQAERAERLAGVGEPDPVHAKPSLDVARLRAEFPILAEKFHGQPLVYLDNGATTQKPRSVIETIDRYYRAQNSNIHRGVYTLSQVATNLYEEARKKVARFINAPDVRQVLFTRGTTESINLVAQTYGRSFLKKGDEILLSGMEHHSNIVPWQLLCEQTGAVIKVIPFNDRGELLMDEFDRLLSERTKFVSVVHVSNSLGTVNPVREIIRKAHAVGAKVLVDGAQWVAHGKTDVQDLDVDFYAFSAHKIYGPTGMGCLYGRLELLEAMPPWQGGGDMISSVSFEKTTYNDLPYKFEAGTPHIGGAIAFGAAIDWVQAHGVEKLAAYEHELLEYATGKLEKVPGLKIVGTARQKAGVISFRMLRPDGSEIGSHDIGTFLDMDGIAIRTGHHCCQPVMDRFRIASTARASIAAYNTRQEVDQLADALHRLAESEAENVTVAAPAPLAASPTEALEQAFAQAKAVAASPAQAGVTLGEDFELLGEREAKNEYVLDLAKKLPHTFDLLKGLGIPRVQGCMSEVYLLGRPMKSDPQAVEFVADANAEIVRGLIAILQKLFSGQKAKDILAFDIEAFFHAIGLDQFITTQRRNGLAGMVKRIRELAERTQAAGGAGK